MITQTTKLGGSLIKWVLKKKDGRTYERNCNIHNTITKACLNNLFEFNGPGSTVGNNANDYCGANLWITAGGTNNRYGVFNSCALGNGTGTTSVDDTELKTKIGAYSSTKWAGNIFTAKNEANNTLTFQFAHVHTIAENFTIKEIGWFNRIYPDGAYSLSARVQLDEFVDVEAGDTFYTVYQVVMQFALPHAVNLPVLGKAVCLMKEGMYAHSSGYYVAFPYVNWNNVGQKVYESSTYPATHIAYEIGYLTTGNNKLLYYMTTDNNDVTDLSKRPTWNSGNGVSPFAANLHSYTQDSFYRDFELSFNAVNANVYSFVVNGCILRLGEYDENNNFIPNPYYMDKALKFTLRQRISTNLLTPAA